MFVFGTHQLLHSLSRIAIAYLRYLTLSKYRLSYSVTVYTVHEGHGEMHKIRAHRSVSELILCCEVRTLYF
jgi:hypothetical protein